MRPDKAPNHDEAALMRMIYVADVHGAFERVKTLLSEATADLFIIAGDLIDIPFYGMNTAIHYHELQSYFHGLRVRMNREETPIEDFVDELLNSPDLSEAIEEKGSRYQQYTIRARRVLQQKYKVLENIIAMKQKTPVFCLPGNYDMDLKYTSLHKRDLHLHRYDVQGLSIAGYGGAEVWTPGIPERYVVRYREGDGHGGRNDEMVSFFETAKPDVVVTHRPAHGIFDRVTQFGTSGSPALRSYCDNHQVLACLTGHIHGDWGCQRSEGTVFLNPSNFGEVTLLTGGVSEGGFFYSLDIADRRIERVTFQKLVEDRVYDVAEYFSDQERWVEKIIDRGRYDALKAGRNFDMKAEKYSHIPEIRLYNEIKQFFRMFQTEATDERLDKLAEVVRLIEAKIRDDVGMDLLGSANMGLCETGSDIDLILYIRCNSEGEADLSACEAYRDARAILEEVLRPEYAFQILDCVDLGVVEKAIREKDYESEMAQRFVAYRSLCRPINYRVIAPVEDLLNQDLEFRSELEGSVRSYFNIFINTSQHVRSFEKYERRINEIGIKVPAAIRQKIKAYLQQDADSAACKPF